MPASDQHDQVPVRRRDDLPAGPTHPDQADRPPAPAPAGNASAEATPPAGAMLDAVLAGNFRTMGPGLYLYAPTGQIFRQMGPMACVSYVTGILEDAGDPVDPLERLLVEELIHIH